MPPPFRGGSLSSPRIFPVRHKGATNKGDKIRRMRGIKKSVGGTPTRFFMVHPPPLTAYPKACGPSYHENRPRSGPSFHVSEAGCPVRRIVVNLDAFRQTGLREFLEFEVTIHHSLFPSIAHE